MSFFRCFVLFVALFAPLVLANGGVPDEIEAVLEAKHRLSIAYVNSRLTDTSHLIDGDILRHREDEKGLQARGGIYRRARLWPFNSFSGHYEVPFELAREYSIEEKAAILHSFDFIAMGSNVRLVPQTVEEDFISIVPKDGCWSALGRTGGVQEISLHPDCIRLGAVVHQVFHALGLSHEHQRPDRDYYIDIRWDYIADGRKSAFAINPESDGGRCSPYDYASMMHYGATAFHKDGAKGQDKITIVPYYQAGKRPLLSNILAPSSCDWYEVNLLYPIGGKRFQCVPHQMPPTAFPRPDCVSPIASYNCTEFCVRQPYNSNCQLPESGFPDLPPNHPNGITSGSFDPSVCGVKGKAGFLHQTGSQE